MKVREQKNATIISREANTMGKLKPCPFCGGNPRQVTDHDIGKFPSSIIVCEKCESATNRYVIDHVFLEISRTQAAEKAKAKAAEAWNKRVHQVVNCENCLHGKSVTVCGNGQTEPPYIDVVHCQLFKYQVNPEGYCSYGKERNEI